MSFLLKVIIWIIGFISIDIILLFISMRFYFDKNSILLILLLKCIIFIIYFIISILNNKKLKKIVLMLLSILILLIYQYDSYNVIVSFSHEKKLYINALSEEYYQQVAHDLYNLMVNRTYYVEFFDLNYQKIRKGDNFIIPNSISKLEPNRIIIEGNKATIIFERNGYFFSLENDKINTNCKNGFLYWFGESNKRLLYLIKCKGLKDH